MRKSRSIRFKNKNSPKDPSDADSNAFSGSILRHSRTCRLTAMLLVAVVGASVYLRFVNGVCFPWASTGSAWASVKSTERFPLKVDRAKRHLIDRNGSAFVIHGDAAWSLIADLRRDEVDIYLADRRARGFNTLLVNLIEHKFSRYAPANAYGNRPFDRVGDFSSPSHLYFSHVDWVLKRAREMGFLVLLTPSYAGYGGKDEGWWREMIANGPDKLHEYGRFLGGRYGHLDNIIWVNGGDFDPPNRSLVEAIATGIKEAAPGQLQTVHNAPETRVDRFWRGARWLDILNVYTYNSVCDRIGAVYASQDRRPFFLIESAYENEHGAGPHRVRVQAYHALLCGAGGQVFGNNPVWHFNHRGLFPSPADWRQSLDSGGANSMATLSSLIHSTAWDSLVPDLKGNLIVEGRGYGFNLAAAAYSADGSFAVIYCPTKRTITIDLRRLGGKVLSARWFDPVDGSYTPVDADTFNDATRSRERRLWRVPTLGTNSGGDSDWVLLVEAEATKS